MEKKFDLIVWGATGFTGKLVVEYLSQAHIPNGLRVAIGGRDLEKLKIVSNSLGLNVELFSGDCHDQKFLNEMVKQTKVICSLVGPYAKYGSELVRACAENGVHYCDITGEVQWIRKMIEENQEIAKKTGARIVHACGFDSIPSDLGCFYLQSYAMEKFGAPAKEVHFRLTKARGGVSGGTIASMMNLMDEISREPSLRKIVGNPRSLCISGDKSSESKELSLYKSRAKSDRVFFEYDVQVGWIAPFVMAAINTRVVRRTNYLLGNPWGEDFEYDEAVATGRGLKAMLSSALQSFGWIFVMGLISVSALRKLIHQKLLPQPGQGPSQKQRDNGCFEIVLYGLPRKKEMAKAAPQVRVVVSSRRDPGYGSTCRMLAESAVLLAKGDLKTPGGVHTPASCFGLELIEPLRKAGIDFQVKTL